MSRRAAFIALAAIACLLLGACSPGADYPSLFPSVHDIPPPRNDTPLDRNQVQQATEDLISARDRLSAEAQGASAKTAAKSPAGKSSDKSSGKSSAKSSGGSSGGSSGSSSANSPTAAAAVKKPSGNQVSGRPPPGPAAEQTAGGETK